MDAATRFRFYYAGAGRYDVWERTTGPDVKLGRIFTTAPVALSANPGKWFTDEEETEAVDSMNDAAQLLALRVRG